MKIACRAMNASDSTILQAKLLIGVDGRALRAEESVAKLLGFTPAQLLSGEVRLLERIHPADGDLLSAMQSAPVGGEAAHCNLRVRQADGRILCCRARYRRLRVEGADGAPLELLLQDARTLPRTLEDPSSQPTFAAMLENSDDFFYVKDRHHVFVAASDSLAALCSPTGLRADLIGKTDYDVFAEEYADHYYQLEKQVFSGERTAQDIQTILRPNGESGVVDNRKYAIRNAAGEIVGAYGIARDITEVKRAEAANRESEHQLRSLYNAMTEGLALHEVVLDDQGRAVDYIILDVNPAYERLTRLSRAQVVGQRGSQAYGTGQAPFLQRYAQVAFTGVPRRFDEYFEVMGKHFVISAFSPGPNRFVTVFQDVTDAKAAERSLRRLGQLYQALSQCNQAIVRSRSADELFPQVCRAVVQLGGMKMAWIGLVDESSGLVQPVASFGDGTGYLDGIQISARADTPSGTGPTGQAMRENQPVWCQDFLNDHRTGPWHERGAGYGWRASGSLPLCRGGAVIGAMTLYADYVGAFDEQVMQLLVEMAADISFALDGFAADQARAAAEQQLRKLSMAVDQSPESIVVTNTNAEIEYVNEAFLRVTGYTRDEVLGANPRVLQSGRTPASVYREMWDQLLQGRAWSGELVNQRKNGEHYTELAIISPVRQADGHVSHYVAVKQDVTDKKRVELDLERHRHHLEELVEERTAELTVAREQADLANQAKSTFLATMSHEIRTPMNAIIGFSNLLRTRLSDAKQREWLEKIITSGQHLLAIINDILDFSKIEAGKLELAATPVSLRGIVSQVLELLDQAAQAKGVRLEHSIDPINDQYIADQTRLTQALLNLGNNAVKFTDHGTVTLRVSLVEATRDSSLIRFEVIDTGPGIAPEMQARLFQPFEQGDASHRRITAGTGLGLAITRRLAQLMGGDSGCTSRLGEGSVFWFTARLRPAGVNADAPDAAVAGPDAAAPAGPDYAGLKVLLAEDDPLSQEVGRALLEDLGLGVDVASDGAQAVAMACAPSNHYAAIFMDMQMPYVNGVEATGALRRAGVTAPIIAMTANAFAEDRERCLAAGMDAFLAKPVNPDELAEKVAAWVGR